jgi:predicted glycoside hydrolase/deacetylase ChbG (UPF0249 family)
MLGHPDNARLLLIHADDFGMSHSVNRATALAFENRWITSASVMVTCPWFPEAAKFAREHPEADIGVHLTLNSEWTQFRWGPVTPHERVPSLLDAEGYLPLLESEVIEKARVAEVEVELSAQIEKARRAGIDITHLDSHMLTVFGRPDLFSAYLALGRTHDVPLRVGTRLPFAHGELSPPSSLLEGVCEATPDLRADQWLEGYKKMLASLSSGLYQLTVHLGFDDEEMRGATSNHPNWGAAWRQRDLDLVRSPEFRTFLNDEGFNLVSWRDLARSLVA